MQGERREEWRGEEEEREREGKKEGGKGRERNGARKGERGTEIELCAARRPVIPHPCPAVSLWCLILIKRWESPLCDLSNNSNKYIL